MEIFKQIAPLKAFLKTHRQLGKTVGLVPTMGALHPGHLSLVSASRAENGLTVASIYVNPTQFNNPADLAKYPRTLTEDTNQLEKVGCDVLFYPENEEMYTGEQLMHFDFGNLDKVMEGEFRPGHFSGVALVVSKLFHVVSPDHAYFGQKDFQQFAVIRQMVEELKFGITLHSVPTTREENGLAMSSRNLRLSSTQREDATVFFKSLKAAQHALLQGKSIDEVKQQVKKIVEIPGITLEYFEVADSRNLTLLKNVEQSVAPVLCIAGFVGEVRLIDNLYLYA